MKKIYCMHCGTANNFGDHFCIKCGSPLEYGAFKQSKISNSGQKNNENIFENATRTINSWTGEDKSVQINLSSFFSQVWKRHTEVEAENIFIAGTQETTPTLDEVSSNPVQPWLYSRIFIGLMIVIGMIVILYSIFGNNLYTLLIMMLSVSVPVTLLIFFFEINVFKNISFYLTMKIFLIGGFMSLLVTMLIYGIVGTNKQFDITGSLLVGFVEETGKLLVGAYFVSKLKLTHVFNGMLVGGAIGAGFAAIENIQYANNSNFVIITPLIRSVGSLGTHAIWCAITVAALVLVNGNRKLTFNNVTNLNFFRFYLCAVILHALWDLDTPMAYFKMVMLICAGWLVLFVLIHTGLREVKFIQNQLKG